jgi:serine/threonine protein kinase
MKELEIAKINKYDKRTAVFRERDILDEICGHPNMIKLECTYSDSENLYFLTDFADNGPLTSMIRKVTIPIEATRFFVAEIVLALEYLHSLNIIHRDLKPGNVLFDSDYHVKICDFGEAKEIEPIDRV